MITILEEEEDYGSFDSNQGTSNPRNENRSKGHFNQSEDSLNVDTVEDQEKMTTESLQRQDSIKNWLEFKSEEVKRDSFGKAQKNPNIEIFPTVIKGLDLESSHHKSVSLGDVQQKSSFTRKDSGLSRGGSLGSDSNKANLSRNEVLNDKDTDKYERLSDYEDVNGRSSMSLDESMMSNLSNFNMPGNFNKQPPAGEVYDALNKIIESKNCEDPEKLLFSVIGKEPLEMFDHPKSFWEKLRRKENKYRENQ